MGLLSKFFGGGKGSNPANAAMPYMNQIAPMAQRNLGPYQEQGQQAQTANISQFNSMANDPASFLAQLRATYTPSEGYKFKQAQMEKAMRGAAAAGGFGGTTASQTAQADLVRGLLSQDEMEYVDKLLGIQGTGLQGRENVANRGFGASSDLTNVLGSTLANQGQLAFKGQENKNATRQAMMRQIMQMLGGAAGFAFGGPMGAIAGNQIAGGSATYPNFTQQAGSNLPPVGSGQ